MDQKTNKLLEKVKKEIGSDTNSINKELATIDGEIIGLRAAIRCQEEEMHKAQSNRDDSAYMAHLNRRDELHKMIKKFEAERETHVKALQQAGQKIPERIQHMTRRIV